MLEEPLALCDAALRLLAANPAFVRFCGAHDTTAEALVAGVAQALARTPALVPGEGERSDVEVALPGRSSVQMTVARRGATVALRGRHEPGRLMVAERALLEQARTEGVLLDLSRSVAEATGEEELVAAVARGVKELFPGRTFCIRIVDARTGGLTSLYAEGRLKEGAHEPLVLKQSAVSKTHLSAASLPEGRVVVAREVPLLFTGTTQGVSAPLVASGQLFGAVNMEYPEGLEADIAHDERVLLQLANQVAVAVRNAKLIDELTFVRKYLEELLEKANALILVANRDKQVVVFNQALSALTGFKKEEVLGRDAARVHPRERAPARGLHHRGGHARRVGEQLRDAAALARRRGARGGGHLHGAHAPGRGGGRHRHRAGHHRRQGAGEAHHPRGEAGLHRAARRQRGARDQQPDDGGGRLRESLLMNARVRPDANPADVEKLRRILESSQRILRFTQDLVSYARPGKDKPELVQLNALLDRAVGYCEHVVAQAKVSVRREYTELPPISAVRANLVQVFVNLITNACHAMAPGGQVTLTTRREGQEVLAEVRDTGTGIDPKNLGRIFDPFFTTKEEGKGTGLGLSIVQGIVESHGGRITVDSALGKGTTFTLRLPLPAQ